VLADLRTEHGLLIGAGTVDLWRTDTEPDELLVEGMGLHVTGLWEEEPGPEPVQVAGGWGWGASVRLIDASWSIGPAVRLTTWRPRIWRWHPEFDITADFTLGGGHWSAGASATISP
jgi:hypothetical protein